MGFLTDLRDRFIVTPVAKRITDSLTVKQPSVFSVPVGFNSAMSTYNKRVTSNSVDWSVLRSLSINHETTRAAINVRKRQITQLGYDVVDIDDDNDPETTVGERQKVRDLLTTLGGEKRFRNLLDTLIEDVLVLDACVFYKQRDRVGRLIKIIPIDGATIKLRVDNAGSRPVPPEIAYEQWIRGQKVIDMTTLDLTYELMNPRNDTPYGLSPLESLLITLDSSMRAMLYNLNYLSDNNVPQGFLAMPEGWTPDQIKEYKEWFDALVGGSSKSTAKVYPIPAGTTYQATSKPSDFAFRDMFDYLDRKVCMMFDLSPQELGINLKQYKDNAEGQEKIQIRKGIKPLANFFQEIFTDIIQNEFGYKGFAFKFTGIDGKYSPEDMKTLIPIGVLSIDEARNDIGLKKLDVDNFVLTGAGITPVSQIATISGNGANPQLQNEEEVDNDPTSENQDKKAYAKKGVNTTFEAVAKMPKFRAFKTAVRKGISEQIEPFTDVEAINKIIPSNKADAVSAKVDDITLDIKIVGLDNFMKWAFTQGGQKAYDTLKITNTFNLKSSQFADMLDTRTNYLIDSVNDTTKDWIIDQIVNGKDDNLTNDQIARNIADEMDDIASYRADMIVNTEVANAMQTAELGVYQEQGIEEKSWITSEDELVCPICEPLDNEIAKVDDSFSSGDDAPPAHPNAVLEGTSFYSYGELQEMVSAEDYDGEAIIIKTSKDHEVTIGINHPMLTQRGLVKARDLTVDDYLLYDTRVNNSTPFGSNSDFQQVPLVEDAFSALIAVGATSLIATPAHDLHGDKIFCKGEINVIKPADGLLLKLDSFGIEQFREGDFMEADMQAILKSGDSASSFGLDSINLTSPGLMSSSLSCYYLLHIQSIHYVKIKCKAFDASTSKGLYNSNGFVVSNCRCYIQAVLEKMD